MLKFLKNPKIWFYIVAFAAVFLRFWVLEDLPRGIFDDEAYNGADALRSLDSGFQVFYEKNFGREGLWIWLTSIAHLFLKPSAFALRFVSAAAGSLTVVLIPSFIKTLTHFFLPLNKIPKASDTLWAGLFIMGLIATSYWHVNFSRIAFRAILDPLFSILSLMFVMRAFMSPKKIKWSVIAGIFSALGLYGYGSFKFLIFPLIFITIFAFWRWRSHIFKPFLIMGITGLVFAFPFLDYVLENQDRYFQRLNTVSVAHKSSPLQEFMSGFWRMVRMFVDLGDSNKRHNFGSRPAFNFISQIGAVFGFILLGFSIFKQKASKTNPALLVFVLFWWICMLIPPSLTHDGLPHALRGLGAVAPAYIFAGLGLWWLFSHAKLKKLMPLAFILLFGVNFWLGYKAYHVDFKSHGSSAFWFKGDKTKLARETLQNQDHDVYVVEHNQKNTWDYQIFHYLAPSAARPDHVFFLPYSEAQKIPNDKSPKVIIGKKEILQQLKNKENENVKLEKVD